MERLADVSAQFLADSYKCAVDIACSTAHAGCCRQSNQCDDQQILDQSLASFVVVKSLHQSKHPGHFRFLLSNLNRLIRSGASCQPSLEQGVLHPTMVRKASPGLAL